MRVSTSFLYQRELGNITQRQQDISKTSMQVSTMKRVVVPSDDPVASARALEVQQSKDLNTRYKENGTKVNESLDLADSCMSDVTSALQRVKELVVSAGSPALNDANLKAIAGEIRTQYTQIFATANKKDGTGEYIFAGGQGKMQPFVENTGVGTNYGSEENISYVGDTTQRTMQITSSRYMAMSETGDNIFVDVKGADSDPNSVSMFKTLNDLVVALEKGRGSNEFKVQIGGGSTESSNPADGSTTSVNKLGVGLQRLDSAINNISTIRASIGSRMREVEASQEVADTLDLHYSTQLQDLQDADYPKILSDLSLQRTLLDAAYVAFQKVQGANLFQYL